MGTMNVSLETQVVFLLIILSNCVCLFHFYNNIGIRLTCFHMQLSFIAFNKMLIIRKAFSNAKDFK